jgi:hypothetical protein
VIGRVIPHGFHVVGGKASRLEQWRERREARAFDELVTKLRRKFENKGVCRHCGREVGLLPGEFVAVTRYHRNAAGAPCVGRGRAAA